MLSLGRWQSPGARVLRRNKDGFSTLLKQPGGPSSNALGDHGPRTQCQLPAAGWGPRMWPSTYQRNPTSEYKHKRQGTHKTRSLCLCAGKINYSFIHDRPMTILKTNPFAGQNDNSCHVLSTLGNLPSFQVIYCWWILMVPGGGQKGSNSKLPDSQVRKNLGQGSIDYVLDIQCKSLSILVSYSIPTNGYIC